MSIPLLPESAPFSVEQRAFLNGFLAGLLGVGEAAAAKPAAPALEETFPWHDPALPLDERLEMAAEKPFPRVLMAAMAQLDCGSCGYLCQSYAEAIASGADSDKDLTKCSPGGKETKNKLKELIANRPSEDAILPATPKSPSIPANRAALYDRLNPFPAPILEIRPLTRKDSQKDVRFVSFGLHGSGLSYEAGDALGVFPENCAELVEEVLSELDATGHEPTVSPEKWVVPARVALAKGYVINQVSDEFLEKMAELAARDDEKERLQHLVRDDAENYLEGRDVLDILHDFPSARPREAAHVGALAGAL